jgi:hypothetical protein
MKHFIKTLTSGVMASVLVVHASEDVVLLTIGKFAPLPTIFMYIVGLGLSWVVFGLLLSKVLPHKHEE